MEFFLFNCPHGGGRVGKNQISYFSALIVWDIFLILLVPLNVEGNGVVDQVLEADGRRNERKALQRRERQRE